MSSPTPPPPPRRPLTPAQQAVAEQESAATDEDASSLIPALLAVLAAYATYRGVKSTLKGPWTAMHRTLDVHSMIGKAMLALAERALARQRGRGTHGGKGSLLPYADDAAKTSVETQIRTLTHALQHYQRHPGTPLPNVHNPPNALAEQLAVVGRNTAQLDAEIRAFTDPEHPQTGSLHKNWITMGDSHVRTTHQFLGSGRYDYHSVPVSAPFVSIDGAQMNFPGDTSLGAPLSEVIACRCFLTYSHVSQLDPDEPQYLPAYWIHKKRGDQPHNEQARRDAVATRREADAARREAIYLSKFGPKPVAASG